MRMADEQGTLTFSLTRLGREMGVDPTAMYRYFRNKDELMLAMGDAVLTETLERIPVADGHIELLRATAWALRGSYLSRPALAVTVAARFTGGESERRMTQLGLDKLMAAGLDRQTAEKFVRTFADMVLGGIIMTANLLMLPIPQQRGDVAIGLRVYHEEMQPPDAEAVEEGLRAVREDSDQTFHLMLETFLRGLELTIADTVAKAS
ncbi:TetR/AcrR family transcriptional regulator [Angustibacter sp. McL0619]|uniref:TetR/AcrR family transcriptional regulator n=1 Tax=Angustibacter sp. McL0619 TaxID=3415676 RepID=UPI003CFA415F